MRCSGDWDVFHVAPQILHCQPLVLRPQMATRILLQRQLDLEYPSLPLTSMFHPEPSTAFCGVFYCLGDCRTVSFAMKRDKRSLLPGVCNEERQKVIVSRRLQWRETKGHCFQAFAIKRDKRSLFPGVCNEERQKVIVSRRLQWRETKGHCFQAFAMKRDKRSVSRRLQWRETKGHCFQAFAMKRAKRSLFPGVCNKERQKGNCFQALATKRDKRSLFPGVCNEERQKVTVSRRLIASPGRVANGSPVLGSLQNLALFGVWFKLAWCEVFFMDWT